MGKLHFYIHSFVQSFTPKLLIFWKFFINRYVDESFPIAVAFESNATWKAKIVSIRACKWHLRQVVSLRRSIQIRVEFQSIPCLVGCMVPRWSIQWLHCCQRLRRRPKHAECLFQCLHLVWHFQCISKDWQKKKNDRINTSHFEWNESADYDTYLTIKQWRLLKCSEDAKRENFQGGINNQVQREISKWISWFL